MSAAPVFAHILDLHLEELDFLCEQCEALRFAPDWTLRDLAELELRAEAHLNGLAIGGAQAAELALGSLGGKPAAVEAAARVLLALGDAEALRGLGEAFAAAEGDAIDGLRRALRHAARDALEPELRAALAGGDAARRVAAADVLAFRRLPFDAAALGDPLALDEPHEQRLALSALGRLRRFAEPERLRAGLASPEPAVRRAALEAATRSVCPGLLARCREAARVPEALEAVEFLGVIGERDDLAFLRGALRDARVAAAAAAGLGTLGAVEAVPDLLDALERKESAEAASAAFLRITGAALSTQPRANPDAPDEEGPLCLAPDQARAFWRTESKRFAAAPRWQAGRDVSGAADGALFRTLPLATRRDLQLRAALERSGAAPEIELESAALVQLSLRPAR